MKQQHKKNNEIHDNTLTNEAIMLYYDLWHFINKP